VSPFIFPSQSAIGHSSRIDQTGGSLKPVARSPHVLQVKTPYSAMLFSAFVCALVLARHYFKNVARAFP
jgi:hypothetical protein